MAGNDPNPVVNVEGVHKSYSGVHALRGVTIELHANEIVGLLGANGAGKSTLIKVIAGVVRPDAGRVLFDGEALPARGAIKAAQDAGVAVVPQELELVLTASVAENILLWRLPTRGGLVNRRAMEERARRLLQDIGVDLDVRMPAAELTAVQQRLILVAAAVSHDPRILILDEPTAALPPEEADNVLDVARRVRDLGKTVVFVSHRLHEVSKLVDRAIVMREGEVIGELSEADLEVRRMVTKLGGARMEEAEFRGDASRDGIATSGGGTARLVARGLCGARVHDVDVEVRVGEILGIAGLVGAGRSELIRLLGGVQATTGGDVLFDGRPVEEVRDRRRRIGYIGEDRSRNLFREFDVTGNVSLPSLERYATASIVRRREEVRAVGGVVESVKLKGTPRSSVWGLSGGNRQKVLLGRWLMSGANVLLLDEPTAGLDPMARAEVHDLLRDVVRDGGAVVVAIADPAELLSLCDRVVVMREGRLAHAENRPFDERIILAASYGEH